MMNPGLEKVEVDSDKPRSQSQRMRVQERKELSAYLSEMLPPTGGVPVGTLRFVGTNNIRMEQSHEFLRNTNFQEQIQ